MRGSDVLTLKPTGPLPETSAQRASTGLAGGYRLAMLLAAIIAGTSAITLSASSGDAGGMVWVSSLMGIAVGILVIAAAYSLGTRDKYASVASQQRDSMNQMQESFESLAGRDWMTGLDTFSVLAVSKNETYIGPELREIRGFELPGIDSMSRAE